MRGFTVNQVRDYLAFQPELYKIKSAIFEAVVSSTEGALLNLSTHVSSWFFKC